jgi:hypothetical protein
MSKIPDLLISLQILSEIKYSFDFYVREIINPETSFLE